MSGTPLRQPPAAPVAGSPLDQARATFAWLTRGPGPVTIDGSAVAGLPARALPVDEVRDLLAHPSCTPATGDAIWAYLIRRARAHGDTATVICAGMALPALDRVSHRLTRTPRTGRRGCIARASHAAVVAEVESAVLSGFLTELAVVDLRTPGIGLRLIAAADDAGRLACRDRAGAPVPRPKRFGSCLPPPLARHPDLVLARAVAAGAITRREAVLIGSTRLEPITVAAIARARGHAPHIVRAARVRAERKLATYLREVHLGDLDVFLAAGPGTPSTPPRSRRPDRRRTGTVVTATDPAADGAADGIDPAAEETRTRRRSNRRAGTRKGLAPRRPPRHRRARTDDAAPPASEPESLVTTAAGPAGSESRAATDHSPLAATDPTAGPAQAGPGTDRPLRRRRTRPRPTSARRDRASTATPPAAVVPAAPAPETERADRDGATR